VTVGQELAGRAGTPPDDRARHHPDDESITTGGTLARCAAEGVTTCLVTCTDGRYGPVNPDLGLALSPDDLASMRSAELHAAAAALGVGQVRQLGYHDSGIVLCQLT
jgi:LmbE family N-acetylglucosaminyl deacetylase